MSAANPPPMNTLLRCRRRSDEHAAGSVDVARPGVCDASWCSFSALQQARLVVLPVVRCLVDDELVRFGLGPQDGVWVCSDNRRVRCGDTRGSLVCKLAELKVQRVARLAEDFRFRGQRALRTTNRANPDYFRRKGRWGINTGLHVLLFPSTQPIKSTGTLPLDWQTLNVIGAHSEYRLSAVTSLVTLNDGGN